MQAASVLSGIQPPRRVTSAALPAPCSTTPSTATTARSKQAHDRRLLCAHHKQPHGALACDPAHELLNSQPRVLSKTHP